MKARKQRYDFLGIHSQNCERCRAAMKTYRDLELFDHQLCPAGMRIFRGNESDNTKAKNLPTPTAA